MKKRILAIITVPISIFLILALIQFKTSGLSAQTKTPVPAITVSAESKACLECHGDKNIAEKLSGSLHKKLECVQCHAGANNKANAHYDGGPKPKLVCDNCHGKVLLTFYANDIHGKAYKNKNPLAPWCNDCHGGHDIVPIESKNSHLNHLQQPKTCGKCHNKEKTKKQEGISKKKLPDMYMESVHWTAVKGGKSAATCSDCHGNHNILPASNPDSSTSKIKILDTCGKCHPKEVEVYTSGSHGSSLLKGNMDVPTCVLCHGDHDTMSLRIQASGKRDYAATQICMWCHGNKRMMARYGLDTSQVDSYMSNFHGLAQKGSFGRSATCADCHNAHDALPTDNPKAMMYPANRATTCGKCHGDSTQNFVMSFTHKQYTMGKNLKVVQTITYLYVSLIVMTIAGMLFHNFIVWSYNFRKKLNYQKKYGTIVRMNEYERAWHWALFVSFTMLGITGMALKFPASFNWMYTIGISETLRAWLHRVCAFVLVASTIAFFIYQARNKFGRRWITEMIPGKKDLTDLVDNLKFYMGKIKSQPKFGVFNYAEKAEYLALIWGTAVMTVTGVFLLFPKYLPNILPRWAFEVARTVHFLEAVLAILSILVWHFYHAIFHPAEYPMDTSWLTGKLTDSEAHHRFTDQAIKKQIPPPPAADDEVLENISKHEWDSESLYDMKKETKKKKGGSDPK